MPKLSLTKLRRDARSARAFLQGKLGPDALDKLAKDAAAVAKLKARKDKYKENLDDLYQSIKEYNKAHKKPSDAPAPQIDMLGKAYKVDPKNDDECIAFIKLVYKQWSDIGKQVRAEKKTLIAQRKVQLEAVKEEFRLHKLYLEAKMIRKGRKHRLATKADGLAREKARKSYAAKVKAAEAEYKRLVHAIKVEYKAVVPFTERAPKKHSSKKHSSKKHSSKKHSSKKASSWNSREIDIMN